MRVRARLPLFCVHGMCHVGGEPQLVQSRHQSAGAVGRRDDALEHCRSRTLVRAFGRGRRCVQLLRAFARWRQQAQRSQVQMCRKPSAAPRRAAAPPSAPSKGWQSCSVPLSQSRIAEEAPHLSTRRACL